MKIVFIILSMLFLQACSSNVKKGDNMMNAEQYDQAVMFYEKANQNDPGDEEIAQKLFQARSRMVAANLIQVRLFRQSDQLVNAAQLLDLSLWHLDTWKVMADSGVKATIDEEVRYSSNWLNALLAQNAQLSETNLYFYNLKRYQNIIKTGLIVQTIARHQATMQQQGKRLCEKMKSQLSQTSHYLVDVWKGYCANFAMAVDYPIQVDNSRFSGINIQSRRLKIDRAFSVDANRFSQYLFKGLENNIWFSEKGGQPLTASISGDIDYRIKVNSHVFTKKYTTEKKTFELLKDPKNPDKEKKKLLKVEKIKNEEKFDGQHYIETTGYRLTLNTKIGNHAISSSEYAAKQETHAYGHSVYFKDAGIRPLQPNLLNKTPWLNGIGREAIAELTQKLNSLWVASYCTDKVNSTLSTAEKVVRCAQLDPNHASVAGWSQQQFGLTFSQLNVLLN